MPGVSPLEPPRKLAEAEPTQKQTEPGRTLRKHAEPAQKLAEVEPPQKLEAPAPKGFWRIVIHRMPVRDEDLELLPEYVLESAEPMFLDSHAEVESGVLSHTLSYDPNGGCFIDTTVTLAESPFGDEEDGESGDPAREVLFVPVL